MRATLLRATLLRATLMRAMLLLTCAVEHPSPFAPHAAPPLPPPFFFMRFIACGGEDKNVTMYASSVIPRSNISSSI